ncbi:MAG TPA: LysE family transporter [Bacteroidia bacterium]|jgi:threonine/homoserine/homoserine lactone efflux protein|nr:LysE family transporter [Bacteroidia bacterium]
MFQTLFQGIAIGFSISILFLFGPSFFALIQASIKNGFKSAVIMAVGISVSDIFLVLCAYFGAQRFIENPKYKVYEGLIGSAVLLGFGLYTMLQKHEDEKAAEKGYAAVANVNKLPLMFVKGFFLNLLNPFVLLFWVGWLATVSHYTDSKQIVPLFIGTFGTVFTVDVLKSFGANRIKKLITPKLLKWIHLIMGLALIIAGIVLLYDVFSGKAGSA